MLHDLDEFKICKDIALEYEYVYYPKHPNAHKSGKIYLHRLIMENYLNRYLKEDEIIHHIDENRSNNNIENLELTTQSEHTHYHHPKMQNKICEECKNKFEPSKSWSKFCSRKCYEENRLSYIPSKEELESLIWTKPTTKIAWDYGVSGVAVGKWCKRYGITKPPRGYWAKKE